MQVPSNTSGIQSALLPGLCAHLSLCIPHLVFDDAQSTMLSSTIIPMIKFPMYPDIYIPTEKRGRVRNRTTVEGIVRRK